MAEERVRKIVKIIGIILSVVIFVTTILEHFDFFDNYFLHTDSLQTVANNLSTSYASVQRIYTPADSVWNPLIDLIYKYSNADFPVDKKPMVVARDQAILFQETTIGSGTIAEWTAPSTPFMVLYLPWPGNEIGSDNYRIAGTIGDLSNWIQRDKDDFNFFINNILLGSLSLAIGIFLALS